AGSVLGLGKADAQTTAQKTAAADKRRVPPNVFEGSIKRAQKYLGDKQAYAEYQTHLKKMLDGFKAGEDPDRLIREVVLSEPDTRTKLAPFVGVAGAEG